MRIYTSLYELRTNPPSPGEIFIVSLEQCSWAVPFTWEVRKASTAPVRPTDADRLAGFGDRGHAEDFGRWLESLDMQASHPVRVLRTSYSPLYGTGG